MKKLGKNFPVNSPGKLSHNSAGQLPIELMTLANRRSPVVNRTEVYTVVEITLSSIQMLFIRWLIRVA